MGKAIIPLLLFVLILALAVYALIRVLRHRRDQARQRQLARTAPHLLNYQDLDPEIARQLVATRQALEQAVNIVSQILNDPVLLIPSEYADPLELWLTQTRKEIER
ncbi:MAG TPA: hypothetical protein VGE30_00730 [Candidatus Saccharimonadales bacterium]